MTFRRGTLLAIAAACFVTTQIPVAHATIMEVTARPATADLVLWNQYGSSFTTIPNGSTFTSTVGESGIVTYATGGNGEVRQQNNGWNGNFAAGDFLNWTTSNANGPLTLAFNTALGGVGAQIQTDFPGAFTAEIQAYAGATFLGTFTENGISTFSSGDNSAIYIGVQDSIAEITSVRFSVTSCAFNCGDFAINQVSLTGPSRPTSVPEPASLVLFGSALVGLSLIRRRKRKSA